MVTATSSSTASTPTSMPATAVPRSKFIPSTLLKQANAKRPQGPEEVEKAINDMDKLNGTSFKGWIRSEENISK